MSELIIPIVVLFVIVDTIVVAWILQRVLGTGRKLAAAGFAPADDDVDMLSRHVTELENTGDEHRVSGVLRFDLGSSRIYYYTRKSDKAEAPTTARDFLFRLERSTPDPVSLFVQPSKAIAPAATRFLALAVEKSWRDSQDLTPLEIPEELGRSNVFAVAGPDGVLLSELVDGKRWALVEQLGDHGAFRVACRGEWCSVSSLHGRFTGRIEGLLETVKELAMSRAPTTVSR